MGDKNADIRAAQEMKDNFEPGPVQLAADRVGEAATEAKGIETELADLATRLAALGDSDVYNLLHAVTERMGQAEKLANAIAQDPDEESAIAGCQEHAREMHSQARAEEQHAQETKDQIEDALTKVHAAKTAIAAVASIFGVVKTGEEEVLERTQPATDDTDEYIMLRKMAG